MQHVCSCMNFQATWKSYYGLDGSLCSELMLHTLVCQQTTKCPPGVETVLSRVKR